MPGFETVCEAYCLRPGVHYSDGLLRRYTRFVLLFLHEQVELAARTPGRTRAEVGALEVALARCHGCVRALKLSSTGPTPAEYEWFLAQVQGAFAGCAGLERV